MMDQKKTIEQQIEAQISILKANSSTMQTPLVDSDGFPRADIDIYAVRGARVRIIELRNDLKEVTDAIGKALERIYDSGSQASSSDGMTQSGTDHRSFAKVDEVAPGSPAKEAVRVRLFKSYTIFLLKVPQGASIRGPSVKVWPPGSHVIPHFVFAASG